VLRAPELDAGLQVGSPQSGAEGQNPLPRPAGHAVLGAAQGTVGVTGCESTLLAYFWEVCPAGRQMVSFYSFL